MAESPARRSRTIAQPIRAGSGCCSSCRTGLRRGASCLRSASPEIRSVRSAAYQIVEIRFGIMAALTRPVQERGRQMKLGIEIALDRVNTPGGIGGRKLRIIAADDGNEPARTLQAVPAALREGPDLGIRPASIGTATAAVAVPYALERRRRRGPAAMSRRRSSGSLCLQLRRGSRRRGALLVKMRRSGPADRLFAQQDDLGDAGFAGARQAYALVSTTARPRQRTLRKTIEVDEL